MVRGEAHLVFRDVNTGEITKEHTQKNVVTQMMLNRLAASNLDFNNGYGRFGDNIMIGGWEQPTNRDNYRLFDIYAYGYNEAGVTSPRYLSGNVGTGGTFAYYYEYQQRFNPPAADRDIYTVGINYDGHGIQQNNYHRPTDAAAYLALTTPCTQLSTETLDVFYRIIWDNPDEAVSGINTGRMNQIASRHSGQGGSSAIYYPNYNIFYYHLSKYTPNITIGEPLNECYCGIGSSGMGGIFGSATYAGGSAYGDTSYRTRIMTFSCSLTQLLGRVVGGVGHLRNDHTEETWARFYSPLLRSTDSPIQNMFGHSAAATGPFYGSTTVPAGGGTCELNGDAWTNPDWNKLFHIEVTGSGNVGVATYKLHVHNLLGFRNNTYEPAPIGLPVCNPDNSFEGQGWFQDGSGTYSNYNGILAMEYGTNPNRIALFKDDTFGWMDLTTMERHRFHATSTPSYDGTNLSQICVVPNRSNVGSLVADDMWVADLNGLYRVTADGSTITKFDTTHVDLGGLTSNECYGVTYTPGRIWAAFDGGLVFTNDNGSSFTVYDGTSTPTFTAADFSRIWFIQGDPAHADHRLAIAYNTEATPTNRADFDIYWWDSVAGHGNTRTNMYYGGTGEDPRLRCETFRLFTCSPDDGKWGCRAYNAQSDQVTMFDYNATTHLHTYATHGTWDERNGYFLNWTKDITGADAMHVVYWVNDNTRFAICKQDGTRVLSDRMYRSTVALGVYSGWYAEGSGYQSQKCITAGGMLIASTLRNNTASGIKGWYAINAWNDNNAPLGGEGYHILWKGYGWDGANWVEGNTNSKTTHAAHETLIDGVTISFDDDTGAEQFFATDHYTCGVVDGVLVDAATEISHNYALYYKPTKFDLNDVEGGGILPAATSDFTYNEPEATRAGGHLIDNTGVSVTGGGDYLDGTANSWRCRINHPMDDYAYFRFRVDTGSSWSGDTMTIGFADASKAGTTVTATDIDFAFRLSVGDTSNSSNNVKVQVWQNGALVLVADAGNYPGMGDDTAYSRLNRNNEDYVYFKLNRLPGTTDLEMIYAEKVVHTFTGVSNTLMPVVRHDGNSGSSFNVRVDSIAYTLNDYVIELGDSGSVTGKFEPEFWAIDYTAPGRPKADTIKIDGVPATTVLVNDYVTPLATGEVDLLTYRGLIRFSSADIGKTLTIDRYNVLLHE